MTRPVSSARSRFVWFENLTRDVPAAIDFYSAVVGWDTQPFQGPPGSPPYTVWRTPGGTTVGGVFELPEQARAMGAPPSWMGNLCVEDVDASAAKLQRLGGAVHQAPFDIPTVGRVAIVADPTGAGFALFQPAGEAPGHAGAAQVGEVSWCELMTTDLDRAWAFYAELLGWQKTEAMDMGEGMGTYQMFGPGDGTTIGGMMKAPMPMSAWAFYVYVADLDRSIATAKDRGATVMHGPTPIPGGDRVAMLTDPQGAVFALHGK